MTTAIHTLDPVLLDSLAGGAGGGAAIEKLRSAQLSKHLLVLRYLLERWPGSRFERDAIVAALDTAATRDPGGFAEVMSQPLVGAWAAITARAASRNQLRHEDFEQLGAVAMVACAVSGVDGVLRVPQRDGLVCVPGWGTAVVASAGASAGASWMVASGGRLRVVTEGTTVHVPPPQEEAPQWMPVRFLAGAANDHQIRLGLNDLDPYRHGHHAPPTQRLSAVEVDRWRELFASAWQMIAELLPERAAELSVGLRALVPLQPTDKRAAQSATLRHAFGVFGLTRPSSAAEFAVTMIHEFQHSKLSAIIDLAPLSDAQDKRRYFAPWRVDPRPLAGLLQGVYAFIGVADAWRALRAVDGVARLAEQRFAEARLQVDRGLAAVEQSGALTKAGEELASGLRRVADRMLAMPVPAAVARRAELSLEQTRQRWLQRNGSHP